jgi:hypothetical protein
MLNKDMGSSGAMDGIIEYIERFMKHSMGQSLAIWNWIISVEFQLALIHHILRP